jgi:hypothetical protein
MFLIINLHKILEIYHYQLGFLTLLLIVQKIIHQRTYHSFLILIAQIELYAHLTQLLTAI